MLMQPLMDRMAAEIVAADLLVKGAFSGITPEKKTRLLKLFPRTMDDFLNNDNLSERDISLIIASAEKVHMAQLLRGLLVLSTFFADDFLTIIRRTGSDAPVIPLDHKKYPGLKGRFLAIRETPAGLMLIGGKGPNVYGMDASLIIDLGGDDLYINNAGAPVYEIHKRAVSGIRYPIGVVIDFEGDDRYISSGFAAVASGFFGLGLILDMAGNDYYAGGQLSLGASFFGMGCLMDMAGNDTYVCSEGGQGCAFFGAAWLFDGKGDDLYQGAKFVQGFGGPMGLGQLHDLRGRTITVLAGNMAQAMAQKEYMRPVHRGWDGVLENVLPAVSVFCLIPVGMMSTKPVIFPREPVISWAWVCSGIMPEMMSTGAAGIARVLRPIRLQAHCWTLRAMMSIRGK